MNTTVMLTEEVRESWAPIINEESCAPITNNYIKNSTIRLLENQRIDLAEATGTQTGAVANYDPVLISMVRRTMPSLIAHDIIGVQPMSGPTGLIFSMKAWYGGTSSGTEAFDSTAPDDTFAAKKATADGEILGSDKQVTTDPTAVVDQTNSVVETNPWPEMSFSIEKVSVTAQTRALKAKYTEELATDLKNIHGLDAETELANILSTELVAEINREIVKGVDSQAIAGATAATTPGTFDLTADTDGRWEIEKLKGLLMQINKEANLIAQQTRRGVGNWIICSANVAGALDIAGKIDTSLVTGDLNVDGVGVTFSGILNGRFKVYIDPYATTDFFTVGYKGSNPYDAGMYYAPYVPLNMVKAIGEDDFQPRIGFKTRYGIAYNPFVSGTAGQNKYFRKVLVTGL